LGNPRFAKEASQFESELLQPFNRDVVGNTDALGFIAIPTGLAELRAIRYLVDANCPPDQRRVYPVQMVTSDQISMLYRDAFAEPRYNDVVSGARTNNRVYAYRTKSGNTDGYRLLPQRTYTLVIEYLDNPTNIAVSNAAGSLFAYEQAYAGNPRFVNTPADINSRFLDKFHEELVNRAVMEYTRSVPDYNQLQVETQRVVSGDGL
jgi:hypothetical protein